ncbi:MAG TPA: hypothetical protein IAC26_09415 [Candidatus Scatomorpha stercoravium]|nr:hypothetical protein [Candidatus Scatomorpha stercoravium]
MRGGLVTGAAAALVCLAAAAWLAEALLPPAEEAAPEGAEALCVRGIAVREEQSVYAPEGGSLILAPEGGRVAAGGILAAVSPTREGLLAAAREAAREEPAVGRSLARAAAYAAASGRAELAEPFAALWSDGPDAAYELLRSPVSAIWSRSTDALEYLGPEALEGLDGDGLAELMALSAGESPAAGRLVTGRRWYFAAALPAGAAALEGGEALLRIAGREYPARLVSLNGGAAVFELAGGLEETLYLRFADAEIVFQGDR